MRTAFGAAGPRIADKKQNLNYFGEKMMEIGHRRGLTEELNFLCSVTRCKWLLVYSSTRGNANLADGKLVINKCDDNLNYTLYCNLQ